MRLRYKLPKCVLNSKNVKLEHLLLRHLVIYFLALILESV